MGLTTAEKNNLVDTETARCGNRAVGRVSRVRAQGDLVGGCCVRRGSVVG
jgi:hypothetical protein